MYIPGNGVTREGKQSGGDGSKRRTAARASRETSHGGAETPRIVGHGDEDSKENDDNSRNGGGIGKRLCNKSEERERERERMVGEKV